MIRAAVAAFAALLSVSAGGAPPSDRIDAIAGAAGLHGLVLVGDADGSALVRRYGADAPAENAVWRWASVTKQLTALIIMQEVAAGRIELDLPVARYWPDWKAANAGTITIRQLLRHQSGLADPSESATDKDGMPPFYRATGAAASAEAEAQGFCAGPPRAAPGGEFHYNNCDFIVLGVVLQKISGKPFADLLADRIAVPLDLKSVGLFPVDGGGPVQVAGFDTKGVAEPRVNLGTYAAAGAAYGTIRDLWAIDRALMDNRLLDKVATAAMWAGDPALGFAALGQWSFAVPLKGCPDPVAIVERRGAIGGIEIRNFLLPAQRRALIIFTDRAEFPFGEVWQASGPSYELLSAAACPA
ncbi:serine hydrolase domain-containing protein [Sphingomonas sp. 1P06PA]|uniref:serine hydrolase domain-containing protein n=1 Tax=Sphingomonas sp. 1P06PA TaxID=554121 RepID=UPI0039A4D0C1